MGLRDRLEAALEDLTGSEEPEVPLDDLPLPANLGELDDDEDVPRDIGDQESVGKVPPDTPLPVLVSEPRPDKPAEEP